MQDRFIVRGVLVLVVLGVTAGVLPSRATAEDRKPVTAVGDQVANGSSLRDLRGNRRALHSFKGNRAVVLAFLGTECPVCSLYLPGLIELEKKYRARQVQFLAVFPNEHEDLDQVAAFTYDRDVPFLVLKDFGQRLADRLGVERVPEVVVLDGDFVVRYQGRIDDRYGVAFRRDKATRDDLVRALEDVLAGKPVSVPATEVEGCLLDRAQKPAPRAEVTYSKKVARILQKRCQSCHRPEQAAPFALLTYDDAVKHGAMIKEVTTQRRMPPWHADPHYGKFANDRRLAREEIDTLAAWVDGGMPQGDTRDLPPPVAWAGGWKLGKPDRVIAMPQEFEVPADGVLSYKHFTVDPELTEDVWVQRAEARPGAAGVVHHIVVYILMPGKKQPFEEDGSISILVGWAPGDLGVSLPPDTGLRLPKGSKLYFELHYTPNGKAVRDRSEIGLTFTKGPPKYELQMNSFDNEAIHLPAREPHYRAEATFRLRADARIISFVPHMHWRGKDYRYEVIYPDGRKEPLLSVPRWDFNWQSAYVFAEPVRLPKGSRLHAVAHWDNSRNNLYNPDPSKAVRFGLQTWDEMMVGWVAYVWERPDTSEKLAREPLSKADQLFDRFDRNGDGVITPDEIPERMMQFLKVAGIKLPDPLDRKAFTALYEEMTRRYQRDRSEKKPAAEKKADGKP